MAYKGVIDKDFMKDIQSRREFVSLKLSREILDKEPFAHIEIHSKDDEELKNILSELMVKTSNQIFVSTLMNPNTKVKRLLLKWSTGIGKTIGALLVAVSMIKLFEQTQAAIGTPPEKMPSIFVVGHTRERVIDDLLKFPEFGFVSPEELNRQNMLNRAAINGGPAEIAAAKDHYVMLKRRTTNKARGGYFRFFGYQELVNRVFGISIDSENSTSDVISRMYNADPAIMKSNILKAAEDGIITLNNGLIEEFNNSFLIVDEIHNAYNTLKMNSWGSTIAYIIDNAINLRVAFMSATPATNTVLEYVDLLNLLCEPHEFPRLTDKKMFSMEELRRRIIGRISFLQDSDLRMYPRREFDGEPIAGIDYLKFIKTPMSELQSKAYNNWLAEKSSEPMRSGESEEIMRDDYYIRDIALPNPENPEQPLFRAKESRIKIANASDDWKSKNQINLIDGKYVGAFLRSENIGTYSSKYKKLIDRLLTMPYEQKIVLFHNYVKMSGVNMLAELLRENGYVDIDSAANENTICSICGKKEKEHIEKKSKHDFMPAKFGFIHGEQPTYANHRILKIYNDNSNIKGIHMRILIGAQMIRESTDLKAVRHIEILSMPINIPILLQVIGRGIRKGSHDGLPPEDKVCNIAIYISTPIEEETYKNKVADYILIQKAEQIIHSCAADAAIHREIIMSPDVIASYGLSGDNDPSPPKNNLGALYYKPEYNEFPPLQNDISFYAYENHMSEINIISLLMRRLFHTQPVWTYEDLWEAVKSPPYRTEINPAMFTEDNFAVALNTLITQMAKKDYGNWSIRRAGKYFIKMPKIYTLPGSAVISAPDAFLYGSGVKPPISVEIKSIINSDVLLNSNVKKFLEDIKLKDPLDLFAETPPNIIEAAAKLQIEHGRDLKFFIKFGMLIRGGDIEPTIKKELHITGNNVVGLLTAGGPMVFVGGKEKWRRVALKPMDEPPEHGPIVGYIEEISAGRYAFKTRKLLKEILKEKITDARLIEKGAVCTTWSREELIGYAKTIARQNGEKWEEFHSVKDICDYIRRRLMAADYYMGGRYRTFYWYFEGGPKKIEL